MSTELVKSENKVAQFNFFDAEQFAVMQRVSTMFASSELVPALYQASATNPKEKAIANCMIAIETAQRIGASPLMVMQNMYIVYGQPAWSAKFLTATVNGCGRYNSIKYKMELKGTARFGDKDLENWECIAYTSEKGSNEILESIPVDIKMAIAEGWYGKKGSKWQTMSKLMLQYRAVTFWTRAYAPELSMGIRPADEIEDYIDYEDVPTKLTAELKDNANKQPIGFDATADQPSDANTAAPQPAAETKPEDTKAEQANPGATSTQPTLTGPGF